MNIRSPLILRAMLIASITVANADDHLFNAQQHGLQSGSKASGQTHAFTENTAGHSGDLAPGQGSPFAGEERKTPATDTDAANDHANVEEPRVK